MVDSLIGRAGNVDGDADVRTTVCNVRSGQSILKSALKLRMCASKTVERTIGG